MTEPTDAELEALLVDKAPILALVGANVRTAVVKAMREAFGKWGTPPAVAPWRSAVLDLIDECPGLTMEQDQWLSRRVKELDFASTTQPTQAQAGAAPQCWCLTCRPMRLEDPYSIRMALCPTCGNKRCPKANDHRNECSGSNEPGQPGSAYSGGIKGGQHAE